VTEVGLLVACA